MRPAWMIATLMLAAGCGGKNTWTGQTFDDAHSTVQQSQGFGSAVAQNEAAMRGQYRLALANRFAREVPTTVTFAFNSTTLSAAAQQTLRQQAAWIKQFPELRFKVYGHTDLVGSASYNRRLGLRRARAVAHFLQAQGIESERLIAAISEGESQPLIVTQGREERNRRTVTEVEDFMGKRGDNMNGKYAEVVMREYITSAQPGPQLTGGVFAAGISEGDS